MSEKRLVVVDSWCDEAVGEMTVFEGGIVGFGDQNVIWGQASDTAVLGRRIARLRDELDAKDDYIGCVLGELRQRNAELESAREAIRKYHASTLCATRTKAQQEWAELDDHPAVRAACEGKR